MLPDGETVASVSAVTVAPSETGGLTATSTGVNEAPFVDGAVTVAIGCGALIRLQAGLAGHTYLVTVTATFTDGSSDSFAYRVCVVSQSSHVLPCPSFVDLVDLQCRTGGTCSQSLAMIASAVDKYILTATRRRYLLDPEVEIDVYPQPGHEVLIMPDRPVWDVVNVWYDPRGGAGQLADTFTDDELLTVGEDYWADTLDRDETNPAYIRRTSGARWQGRKGDIKVRYRCGYDRTAVLQELPDLCNAATDAAAALYVDRGGRILMSRNVLGESRAFMSAAGSGHLGRARDVISRYSGI